MTKVKPFTNNPRRLSQRDEAQLRADLEKYGDLGGIVHDLESGEIVGGNQRLHTLFGERAGEFAVSEADIELVREFDAPDAQGTLAHGFIVWHGFRYAYRRVMWDADTMRAANIKANLDGGDWDFAELETWDTEELREWGFDAARLTAWNESAESLRGMLASDNEDHSGNDAEPQIDKAEELQAKWGVQVGDVWQCGAHYVACGDCTDKEVVARVMRGDGAHLVVTDPPYGVSYADKNEFLNEFDNGKRIQSPIHNDHRSKEETQELWKAAFEQMESVMHPGACVYCFMPQGGDQMMMMMMMEGAGIEPRHELIWLKNNHVLGRVDYAYKHEPIMYAWKSGGHKFYGGFQTSIIEVNRPQKSEFHPTTKPVELIQILVSNSSQQAQVVFDPFLGSGTTLIACENLGRKCRGIEVDPRYVAVALQRFQDATGIAPIKVQ